jgi:hypothetical protein
LQIDPANPCPERSAKLDILHLDILNKICMWLTLPRISLRDSMTAHEAALVGKAGEAAVAAELLRRHIDVAYPAHDAGVDLIAYREHKLSQVVPIQVKARTTTCFEFQKDWFRIDGLVLVQVWHLTTVPEFYIFGCLADVEDALGEPHRYSQSWLVKEAYTVTSPTHDHLERMQAHRDRWDRIKDRLPGNAILQPSKITY